MLLMMNKTELLGRYKNSWLQNVLGLVVIVVAMGLGAKSLYFAFS